MQNINEIKLSKELIRIPSITPVDAGAINFLSKKLKSLGFKCKILEFRDKKSKPIKNLYARFLSPRAIVSGKLRTPLLWLTIELLRSEV